jgi:hypothetical protein
MAYTNIDDPSAYFQTATWSGNSSTQDITNDGNSDLQPDWIWIKQRTSTQWHTVTDTSRGLTKYQYTNSNTTEGTVTNIVTASNTDGFSLGSDQRGNASSQTYVGWQWKCNGGTTSSNTDGDITSTVQVNQDAGFSIIQYTGSGTTNHTIGHGLGVTPNWVIFKRRDVANGNWDIQIDGTSRATLNLTEAAATNVLSSFSSTTVGLSTGGDAQKNVSGSKYTAYAFAEKQGYSKFGTYVGNGSTSDGVFVYLGFKPAFIITKKTSSTSLWRMYDSKRGAFNLNHQYFFVNAEYEERTNTYGVDFLSNGFKMRNNFSASNYNGETYIYMAFAENPFVTSTGVPTTAR